MVLGGIVAFHSPQQPDHAEVPEHSPASSHSDGGWSAEP